MSLKPNFSRNGKNSILVQDCVKNENLHKDGGAMVVVDVDQV